MTKKAKRSLLKSKEQLRGFLVSCDYHFKAGDVNHAKNCFFTAEFTRGQCVALYTFLTGKHLEWGLRQLDEFDAPMENWRRVFKIGNY